MTIITHFRKKYWQVNSRGDFLQLYSLLAFWKLSLLIMSQSFRFSMEMLVGRRKINMYQIILFYIKTAVIVTERNVNIGKFSSLKFRAITYSSQWVGINFNLSFCISVHNEFLKINREKDYKVLDLERYMYQSNMLMPCTIPAASPYPVHVPSQRMYSLLPSMPLPW